MPEKYNPDEKRKRILEATLKTLSEGGFFTNFSLEKIAKKAGVSKGGLLHHFPSKESLLIGASQMITEAYEDTLYKANSSDEAGDFTKAYLQTIASEEHVKQSHPMLLAFIRKQENMQSSTNFEGWQEKSAMDGIDPITASIIRLAADGIFYNEAINGKTIDVKLRKQLFERLEQMLLDAVSEVKA